MQSIEDQMKSFDDIERVVADSLRFRKKLSIGSDAYTSMRAAKTLQNLWDVGSFAAGGASVAKSAVIAGTFFVPSGWLTAVGIGAIATTPLGWVIGAAVASGGAYYGVTRVFRGYGEARVDIIPKFINTPIDLLGASLMDLLGAFSMKIATIDGHLDAREIAVMKDYFVSEWGYDADYTEKAFQIFKENASENRISEMAKIFAGFARSNPDCNFSAIRKELISHLENIAAADGRLDEREEMAIDRIAQILDKEASLLGNATETVSAVGRVVSAPVRAGSWLKAKLSKEAD